ncbi:MAG: type II toxin-antitoxin system VapC family toxin [Desulfotomaculaceae bacterium]|nr:type II toxin-antitoxin system VapC family toxin [Desulfotomaculaceae bacterium]
MKIVVDTNIIIDHLRNVTQATKLLKEIEGDSFEGLISTITILELMAAPKTNEQRLVAIKELLGIFEHIPVDGKIATAAGIYMAKYRASHGLESMDAIIAATARVNEAALFTLNTKHFKFIEGLVVINPYLIE